MNKLSQHNIILAGKTDNYEALILRPMTEYDWDILVKWNSDPDVLHFSEGDDVKGYSLEEVRKIYHSVSKNAFCFIIEINGKPVGECWLQRMNLDRILRRYPGTDCRRIDLMIGEKEYWGRGIGMQVIRLLTKFGFQHEKADIIFGCDIADYNERGLRAFQKVGYRIDTIDEAPADKARYKIDVSIQKEDFRYK